MKKLKIAIVMGGTSAEREVSLKSGEAVHRAIDRERFEPVRVVWRKDGMFEWDGAVAAGVGEFAQWLITNRVDAVFLALHGPGGEDGTIQGFLEILQIPYTGPRVAASAIAMDKIATRAVLAGAGLPLPPGFYCDEREWRQSPDEIYKKSLVLGRPAFIKAPTQGSSYGVTRVADDSRSALEAAMNSTFQFGSRALIEKGAAGVEVTAPTLGNSHQGDLLALTPVEIRPRSKSYFDFEEKYSAGGAEELCPPVSLSSSQIAKIQQLGIAAHRALQCDGMSRTDMIVSDSEIVILEVNTIPGLTERSLLPQAAAASGIPFSLLITKMIEFALARTQSSPRP